MPGQRLSQSAIEAALITHRPALISIARRYLPREDAHDAVQDAILSAFVGAASFRGGSAPYTWLYRITVNACLLRIRRRRSYQDALFRAAATDECLSSQGNGEGHAERLIVSRETGRRLNEHIESLPYPLRVTVLLRDIEGWSTAETARSLGISRNAVKVRLSRGRSRLRERVMKDPLFESRGFTAKRRRHAGRTEEPESREDEPQAARTDTSERVHERR